MMARTMKAVSPEVRRPSRRVICSSPAPGSMSSGTGPPALIGRPLPLGGRIDDHVRQVGRTRMASEGSEAPGLRSARSTQPRSPGPGPTPRCGRVNVGRHVAVVPARVISSRSLTQERVSCSWGRT